MLSAIYVPVAQLDRVLDYESRGRGFESLLARQVKYLLNNVRQVFFCVLNLPKLPVLPSAQNRIHL